MTARYRLYSINSVETVITWFMLDLDMTALWGLLITGALAGVVYHAPGELRRVYSRRHRRWRDAPAVFAEEATVAVLTGVGVGTAIGASVTVGAALLARI
jgi:hypothetical protein